MLLPDVGIACVNSTGQQHFLSYGVYNNLPL